jgi:hypothetical protein
MIPSTTRRTAVVAAASASAKANTVACCVRCSSSNSTTTTEEAPKPKFQVKYQFPPDLEPGSLMDPYAHDLRITKKFRPLQPTIVRRLMLTSFLSIYKCLSLKSSFLFSSFFLTKYSTKWESIAATRRRLLTASQSR